MRKIVLIGFFTTILSMNTFAQDDFDVLPRDQCETILAGGYFNSLLEKICGFNGGVKDTLLRSYEAGHCKSTMPQAKVDALIKEVMEDTQMRYKAFGQEKFCEDNLKGYTDLIEDDE